MLKLYLSDEESSRLWQNLTWHEILDDVHVRKGVNLGGFGSVGLDPAEAGESVDAVDVHGATAADSLSAGPAEGQSRVQLVLDLDQTVQHHGTARVEVNWREGMTIVWRRNDCQIV